MVAIPERNVILEKLEEGEIENNPRPYLGYSMIGEKCLRYLQYYHRMAFKDTITRRINRLFNFGKHMEDVFIGDLEAIGAVVKNQQKEMIGYKGHWKGHIDGTALKIPTAEKTEHLLEFKTHNDDQFKLLKRHNDISKSHPKHFWQATAYMGHLKLTRTLYLGYNKNDSAYYIERLHFDKESFEELEFKSRAIVDNVKLFPRLGPGKESWHECRYCPAKRVCFNKVEPERNCRTCQHVEVHDKGTWYCGSPSLKKPVKLSLTDQEAACPLYELDEELQ